MGTLLGADPFAEEFGPLPQAGQGPTPAPVAIGLAGAVGERVRGTDPVRLNVTGLPSTQPPVDPFEEEFGPLPKTGQGPAPQPGGQPPAAMDPRVPAIGAEGNPAPRTTSSPRDWRHDQDFLGAIGGAAKRLQVRPQTLLAMIEGESDFNPRNRTGSYSGLFQLSADELKAIGVDPETYAHMSRADQVGVFVQHALRNAGYRPGDGDDQLMLVPPFGSREVRGKPDDHIVWRAGSREASANRGWLDANGNVTRGAALQFYKRRLRNYDNVQLPGKGQGWWDPDFQANDGRAPLTGAEAQNYNQHAKGVRQAEDEIRARRLELAMNEMGSNPRPRPAETIQKEIGQLEMQRQTHYREMARLEGRPMAGSQETLDRTHDGLYGLYGMGVEGADAGGPTAAIRDPLGGHAGMSPDGLGMLGGPLPPTRKPGPGAKDYLPNRQRPLGANETLADYYRRTGESDDPEGDASRYALRHPQPWADSAASSFGDLLGSGAAWATDKLGQLFLGEQPGWFSDDPAKARQRERQSGWVNLAAIGIPGLNVAQGIDFGSQVMAGLATDPGQTLRGIYDSIAFWDANDLEDGAQKALGLALLVAGGLHLKGRFTEYQLRSEMVRRFGQYGMTPDMAARAVEMAKSELHTNRLDQQFVDKTTDALRRAAEFGDPAQAAVAKRKLGTAELKAQLSPDAWREGITKADLRKLLGDRADAVEAILRLREHAMNVPNRWAPPATPEQDPIWPSEPVYEGPPVGPEARTAGDGLVRPGGAGMGEPAGVREAQRVYGDRTDAAPLQLSDDQMARSVHSPEPMRSGETNYTLAQRLEREVRAATGGQPLEFFDGTGARAKVNPHALETVAKVLAHDAHREIGRDGSAIGWYERKVTEALHAVSALHPEIATDSDARTAFAVALAVTSNGLKVRKNLELANAAYEHYKKTGTMPVDIGIGPAANQINDGFGVFNRYAVKGVRPSQFADLMATEFSKAELDALGVNTSSELAGETLPGANALGPKNGGGFLLNLLGRYDRLTVDRWLMRTLGRVRGQLTVPADDPSVVSARERFRKALAKASTAERRQYPINLRTASTAEIDALARAIHNDFKRPDPVTKKTYANRTDLNRAAKNLDTLLSSTIDQPSPKERKFARLAFERAREILRERGIEISTADLQAVLWYPEQRLFGASANAIDYAQAAEEFVRSQGKDAPEQRPRLSVESNDQVGILDPSRRLAVLRSAVLGTIRGRAHGVYNRQSPAQPPYIESGASDPGDHGHLNTYTPARPVAKALRTVDVAPVTYRETADASQFHALISEIAASQGPMGGSVHVYSPEEYAGMRLFHADQGVVFALSGDDIVSVGKHAQSTAKRAAQSALLLATQLGGRRLDCFDTQLPGMYAEGGFRAVARLAWNDEHAPDRWDYEAMADYNGGRPDVVFMVYDPIGAPAYDRLHGKIVQTYDEGIAAQHEALREIDKGEAASVVREAQATISSEPISRQVDDDAFRPEATAEQRRLADRVGRALDRRGRLSGIARAIRAEFASGQGADLLGKRVENAHDLATVANILRRPDYETLRVVFVKGGAVTGVESTSCRAPGFAASFVPREDLPGWITERMARYDADGYWLLHNHPSGVPTPSADDRALTMNHYLAEQQLVLDKELPGNALRGHVVIDHSAYGVINPYGEVSMHALPQHLRAEPWGNNTHPLLGLEALNAEAMVALAKRVQGAGVLTMISLDTQGRTRALNEAAMAEWSEMPMARLLADWRRTARGQGGAMNALVLPRGWTVDGTNVVNAGGAIDQAATERVAALRSRDLIVDVVDLNGESMRRNVAGGDWADPSAAQGRMDMRGNPLAREASGGYNGDVNFDPEVYDWSHLPEQFRRPVRDVTDPARGRGYVGYAKSVNASLAEGRGEMKGPELTKALQQVPEFKGLTHQDVKDILPSVEHHTSKFYNRTAYYDPGSVWDYVEELADRVHLRKQYRALSKDAERLGVQDAFATLNPVDAWRNSEWWRVVDRLRASIAAKRATMGETSGSGLARAPGELSDTGDSTASPETEGPSSFGVAESTSPYQPGRRTAAMTANEFEDLAHIAADRIKASLADDGTLPQAKATRIIRELVKKFGIERSEASTVLRAGRRLLRMERQLAEEAPLHPRIVDLHKRGLRQGQILDQLLEDYPWMSRGRLKKVWEQALRKKGLTPWGSTPDTSGVERHQAAVAAAMAEAAPKIVRMQTDDATFVEIAQMLADEHPEIPKSRYQDAFLRAVQAAGATITDSEGNPLPVVTRLNAEGTRVAMVLGGGAVTIPASVAKFLDTARHPRAARWIGDVLINALTMGRWPREQWMTEKRLLDQVAGEDPELHRWLVGSREKAVTGATDTLAELRDRLQTEAPRVAMDREISALVMQYGEGKIGKDDLPEGQADAIIAADKWFRGEYDRLLAWANRLLKRHGKPEILRRENYYTHMIEDAGPLQRLVEAVRGQKAGAMAEVPGPGSPKVGTSTSRFNPFAQRRLGDKTVYDALAAFEAWAEATIIQVYMLKPAMRHAALAAAVLEHAAMMRRDPQLAIEERLGKRDDMKGLEIFAKALGGYQRELSGQRQESDAANQDGPLGPFINAAEWLARRFGSAAIPLSIRSALMQLSPLKWGLAEYGPIELGRALMANRRDGEILDESPFLRRRYTDLRSARIEWRDVMRKGSMVPMEAIEEPVVEMLWRAEYERALAHGHDQAEAIRFADDYTERTVAGRAIGEKPLVFLTAFGRIVAQFQLEKANDLQRLLTSEYQRGPAYRRKNGGRRNRRWAMVRLLASIWVLNELYDHAFNDRPEGGDLIQMLADELRIATAKAPAGKKAAAMLGRVAGEGISMVPGGQLATALTSDRDVMGTGLTRRQFFGRTDAGTLPATVGIMNLIQDMNLGDILRYFVIPYGGNQISKTVRGIDAITGGRMHERLGKLPGPIGAMAEQFSDSHIVDENKRRPKYPVRGGDIPRALLFGPYATDAAEESTNRRVQLERTPSQQRKDARDKLKKLQPLGSWQPEPPTP